MNYFTNIDGNEGELYTFQSSKNWHLIAICSLVFGEEP